MAITTVTLVDDAEKTITQTTDTVLKSVATTTVWKPGSVMFNLQALQAAAVNAVATLTTAESLLVAGGAAWDNATPAQRSALMLGLVRDVRALIRLSQNLYDQPS